VSRVHIETDAIILTSTEVRDDRILHLLTPEQGRLPVVAKRARKTSKRFGGQLQAITLLEARLTLHEGRDLGYVDASSERHSFAKVKGTLERFAYASVMIEVVTHLIPPHGHEPGVFQLLERALNHLNNADEVGEEILALFELRMLRGLGLLPSWDALIGIPQEAIVVLEAWLSSQWQALPGESLFPTIKALETLIQETSGRRLKSRGVLSDLIGS